MKISEIDQALTVYQNWIISTDYDEIDVVIIRQVIQRCKELERKNLGLKKQIENMRRKEEARYKSDAFEAYGEDGSNERHYCHCCGQALDWSDDQ